MSERDEDPYDLPGGNYIRWLDNLGPELHGVSRYPDYPDDMDWSDAILDPLSEAVGRFVRVCSQLEIALFRARSELDDLMTFAEAEQRRKPQGCIEDLRGIADGLPERSGTGLRALLDKAEKYVKLRNGVVHGVYRMNHLEGIWESRRYRRGETGQYELVREAFDRDSLLLATTRASNVAADIFDGIARWRDQLRRAARDRRDGVSHPMVYEDVRKPARAVRLHALAGDAQTTVCGQDATDMNRYRDLAFEDSNPKNHCLACRKVIVG